MELKFAERMDHLSGAATREILKLTADPTIISFAGGAPGRECYPKEQIASITDELLRGPNAVSLLTYGTTDGVLSAREVMAQYASTFGINGLTAQNALMVSGGQQALDLACKALLNKGDVCLVENPTYLTMLQILNSYEARAVGVDSITDGLDIGDLEAKIKKYKPKMLYVVPTFANPTGNTYTLENRRKIAEITARYNVVVIEDDPYSKLRFEGQYVPSMKSVGGDNILFVTSFSKIISPGMRIGVVFGSKDLLRKLEICKQGVDVHTPNLTQRLAELFVSKGYIEPHLDTVRPIYKAKKDRMSAAIQKYMPKQFVTTHSEGGLFIWGKFPEGIDTVKSFPKAIERKVAYVYGQVFYADGTGLNAMRLNFSNASLEQIDSGIASLGELYTQELALLGIK